MLQELEIHNSMYVSDQNGAKGGEISKNRYGPIQSKLDRSRCPLVLTEKKIKSRNMLNRSRSSLVSRRAPQTLPRLVQKMWTNPIWSEMGNAILFYDNSLLMFVGSTWDNPKPKICCNKTHTHKKDQKGKEENEVWKRGK